MEDVAGGGVWKALVDGFTAEEQADLKRTVAAEVRKQRDAHLPPTNGDEHEAAPDPGRRDTA